MRLVDMGDGRHQIDDDRLQHYEHIFISPHEGSYYVQYANTRDLSDLILVQDEKRHEVMLFPNTDMAALSAETWLDQIDVLREWAAARHKRAPLFVERVSILRSLEEAERAAFWLWRQMPGLLEALDVEKASTQLAADRGGLRPLEELFRDL